MLLTFLWAGESSRYSERLQAGRTEDRIPVGARFSAERPGRDADPSPPSSAVIKREELFLYAMPGEG